MGPARNGTATPYGPTIILTRVIYDTGGHYNVSSGQFTCVYSGICFFSLSIYKARSASAALCRIRKNGTWVVIVTAEPKGSTIWDGYLEAGGTLVTHLATGDIVDLGWCTPAGTIYVFTS